MKAGDGEELVGGNKESRSTVGGRGGEPPYDEI